MTYIPDTCNSAYTISIAAIANNDLEWFGMKCWLDCQIIRIMIITDNYDVFCYLQPDLGWSPMMRICLASPEPPIGTSPPRLEFETSTEVEITHVTGKGLNMLLSRIDFKVRHMAEESGKMISVFCKSGNIQMTALWTVSSFDLKCEKQWSRLLKHVKTI